MANSSPSSSIMSGRRRNKTGCMGSIGHLFDFNHALAGRKLLTDKKYAPGLDTLKNSSHDGTQEKPKSGSSKGEGQNGKSPSVSRRMNEVPIKSLIAEEIAKESESKNRSPSVVARLMGLEGLPNESKNKQKMQNIGDLETYHQKLPSEGLTDYSHHSRENVKKPLIPLSRSMSDLSTSKRSNEGGYISGLKSYPHASHSNGHGFVEEVETWKTWKSENNGQTHVLGNLESQLNAKQVFINKKLNEAKLGLSQRQEDVEEEFFEAKQYSDVRQCNKDFFRRFHKQPDSVFAMDLQKTVGNDNAEHHQQGPTRIVVLKPGIGRVRDMCTSQKSSRSHNEFLEAMEIIRENSIDVLQDLRERLQHEDYRYSSRNYQPLKMPKDPREIAKEIARHVRESVTRDMMANKMSLVDHDKSRSTLQSTAGQNYVSSRRDYKSKKVSRHNSTIDLRNKEESGPRTFNHAKGAGSERSRTRIIGQNESPIENGFSRNFAWKLYDSGNSARHSVDGGYLQHRQRLIPTVDLDSSSYSLSESETDSEDQTNDDMYKMMLRSRSVPTRAFSLYSDEEDSSVTPIDNDAMMKKRVTNRSSVSGGVSQAEPLRRSIFGVKGVETKSDFSHGKNPKSSGIFDESSSIDKKLTRINSAEIEKNQCQIDDTGPILDSDSASSVDNFLSHKMSLTEENMLRSEACIKRDPEMGSSATECSTSEKLTTTDAEDRQETSEDSDVSIHSPSVSPRLKAMNSSSDGMMDSNSKLQKDVAEQPSPVSVFDVVYHEESPSSVDFSDISSGLRELRSHLQRLKFIDYETLSNTEVSQEDDVHLTDDDKCIETSGDDEEMRNLGVLADGTHCSKGRELELVYIRDLLVAAGIADANGAAMTRWNSPKQPLALSLFEKMEEGYGKDMAADQRPSYDSRRLLFDRLNEALIDSVALELNGPKWWKHPDALSRAARPPSGKFLLQRIWAVAGNICCSPPNDDAPHTFAHRVAQDLAGKDRWLHDLDTEFELVVHEVERGIFNDLMLDTVILSVG